MATRITEPFVRALPVPGSGETWVWDGNLRGFGLRIRPSGSKSFWVKYRKSGDRTTKKLLIGTYRPGNTSQARELAKEHLAKIALGADPAETVRQEKLGETVSDLFESYLEALATRKKPKTVADYRWLHDQRIRPSVGGIKVAELSRKDAARLHRSLHETPVVANRALAVLSAFVSWAIKAGYRDQSNPCLGIDRYPETKRGLRLTADQTKAVWGVLDQMKGEGENPNALALLRFLLLTGFRPAEAYNLRWQEVDLPGGWAYLEDTKTGASGRPLNALARTILSEQATGDGTSRVFPGPDGQSLKEVVKRLWNDSRDRKRRGKRATPDPKRRGIRSRANLPAGFRLYDLRHSYLSAGASVGVTGPILMLVAGHKDFRTTEGYIHIGGDDPVKHAAEKIGSHIAEALGLAETTKVIPLKRKGRHRHG